MEQKTKIKSVGFDSWDREVFQTENDIFLCDVNLDYSHANMRLYTKCNNDFDGEPDSPVNTEQFIVVDSFSE